MTIAAGFRCLDGVLLAVDSKHNAGEGSYSGRKLWEVGYDSLIVTGAGVDSAILDAVNSLRNDEGIRGDFVNFETIEGAIRRCGLGKDSTLLIAVKVPDEQQARLLRVEEDDQGKVRIVPIQSMLGDSCTFTGTPVAEALCREMFHWLHSPGVPVLAMKELAKHVFGRVFEYDHWCGPPVQANCLFDTGRQIEMIDDFKMPNYSAGYYGYLCGVQRLLGTTICDCVDFTSRNDAVFENSLRELTNELRAMRKNARGPWRIID